MELFLDGVSVGSAGKSGALSQNPGVPVWIGGNPTEADQQTLARADRRRADLRAGAVRRRTHGAAAAERPVDLHRRFRIGRRVALELDPGRLAAGAVRRGAVGHPGARGHGRHQLRRRRTCWPSGRRRRPSRAFTRPVARSPPRAWRWSPGATLRAGERIDLGEGFFTAADLTLEIDSLLTPFSSVADDSPDGRVDLRGRLPPAGRQPGAGCRPTGWSSSSPARPAVA